MIACDWVLEGGLPTGIAGFRRSGGRGQSGTGGGRPRAHPGLISVLGRGRCTAGEGGSAAQLGTAARSPTSARRRSVRGSWWWWELLWTLGKVSRCLDGVGNERREGVRRRRRHWWAAKLLGCAGRDDSSFIVEPVE
jgi:hypothetical protein